MYLLDKMEIPKHIGIIMDGNGRWANKRFMPRTYGHKKGAETFKKIVEHARDIGIKYITVYAFSTENWLRPDEEINGILNILKEYLIDSFNYVGKKVKVKFIGNFDKLSDEIKELIKKVEYQSSKEDYLITLNIAFNYGGRHEILDAIKSILKEVKDGKIDIENIDEDIVSKHLYTSGQPEPDMILRPSGEYRLSNFMLWQSAYSELVFMDILWPDFTEQNLREAIIDYNRRNRRFGGL